MAKKIELEIEIPASVSDVWNAWTTTKGVITFFAPAARIAYEIGGAYEMYFLSEAPEGSRGSEGCQILAFEPERLLMFSWNAPPQYASVRNGEEKTWVILQLNELASERTHLSLTHLGWKNGEEWDKVHVYFTQAWPRVLKSLKKRFINGPRTFSAS